MKSRFYILFLFLAFCWQSCYTTKYFYVGHELDAVIGMDKNQILRTYGVPDRTMDDGKGGSILIYENFTLTTISAASAYGLGQYNKQDDVIFSYGGVHAISSLNSSSLVNAMGVSHTVRNKWYRNIFLDTANIAYEYQTNFGGKYDSYKCLDKGLTWLCSFAFLGILSPIVAVPVIISAKKKGKICSNS
ncbi:MAG: hypothetical protein RMK52_04145 [Chitinophagales bacterium]|nr:hypothetical protein [Chitinophagales bacterium]